MEGLSIEGLPRRLPCGTLRRPMKVYINGKSKYSFTDVTWNAKMIVDNLASKEKLVEFGATDYIELNQLAKLINSTSEFNGEIDDQLILNKSYKFDTSMKVLNFLKEKKNEISKN